MGINIGYVIHHHLSYRNYNLEEAGADVAGILSPEAILSGPYAAPLTLNNRLGCLPHYFGVARTDQSFFATYPVTHLAVDESNWELAVSQYPTLVKAIPIASYWIRDFSVTLFNISDVTGNAVAARYGDSYYETAARLYHRGAIDSALTILLNAREDLRRTKAVGVLLADIYLARGDGRSATAVLKALAERYRTDFHLQLQCGRAVQILALTTDDAHMLDEARRYYDRAVDANRFKRNVTDNLWRATAARFGG